MLATGVLIEHTREPQAPLIDRKSHKWFGWSFAKEKKIAIKLDI